MLMLACQYDGTWFCHFNLIKVDLTNSHKNKHQTSPWCICRQTEHKQSVNKSKNVEDANILAC